MKRLGRARNKENKTNQEMRELYKSLDIVADIFFLPMPPHVLCGLRGPPFWAWQECNRLLRLGRP